MSVSISQIPIQFNGDYTLIIHESQIYLTLSETCDIVSTQP